MTASDPAQKPSHTTAALPTAEKPVPMGTNAIATQLGNLEEDDEFEEFPCQEWTEETASEAAEKWEDNWDDDDVEQDFSHQLREEQAKSTME